MFDLDLFFLILRQSKAASNHITKAWNHRLYFIKEESAFRIFCLKRLMVLAVSLPPLFTVDVGKLYGKWNILYVRCWHLVICLSKCVYSCLCIYTNVPCSLRQLSGLAARPCLSAHPYDIIWHWSSCLLSPPSLLPLPSSSPPLRCSQPGMDGGRDGVCQTLSCVLARSVYSDTSISSLSTYQFQYSCFQVFSSFFYLPITSAFSLSSPLSTCYVFYLIHLTFFPTLCCFPCLSLSLYPPPSFSRSIVNFNLRAGLNGTIRERSMLLIWMPAHLDLGIPHQRKKKSLFSSSGKHIS